MKVSPVTTQRIAVGFMWMLTGITLAVLVFILAFILVHGLPHVTWLVFAAWMLFGLAVYALYGYRKSLLRHPDQPQWR